ncbi:MAG: dehydrogenase [Rhizobium sp.]|uniref:hypothetical protein n=1 Tax=Rhizobium sp. TaxID=391 RepID=UPI0006471C4E
MRLIKILMLTALCLALPACAVSTRSDKLVVVPPPSKLTKPDSVLLERRVGPVDLGDKELILALLEFYWKKDRDRLLLCARKHLELRDFYADRDAGLTSRAVTK